MPKNQFSHDSNNFKIDVQTNFDFDQSNPLQYQYMFKYDITITNHGTVGAQLMTRKWHIFNENNEEKIVEGPGVVGLTPYLKPGEIFTYSSYCPLDTFTGHMYGQFNMIDDQGREFPIYSPRFSFYIPEEYTTL